MNYVYGSSGSFGSIVLLNYIGHDTYTGRRIPLHSKPTPVHIPVHKPELDFITLEDTSVGFHRHFIIGLSIFFHKQLDMLLW